MTTLGLKSIYRASRAMNIFKEFHNCKSKIESIKLDIWFNTQCKIKNLTPKYINIRTNTNNTRSNTAMRIARATWLNEEIKALHYKKQCLTETMYKMHLEIGFYDLDNKFDYLFWKNESILKKALELKRRNLIKKLNSLTRDNDDFPTVDTGNRVHIDVKNNIPAHKFQDRVVNNSNILFSAEEIGLLEKGLKQNNVDSYNNKHTIKAVIAETEAITRRVPFLEREHAKHLITECIKECQAKECFDTHRSKNVYNPDKKIIIGLKEKIDVEELIITKADKGNTTVIMHKKDYIDKTLEFIQSNNITTLNRDPTLAYQRQLKKALKDTHLVLKTHEKRKLISMNPSAPTLKAFPKIHKVNTPIRPIINFRSAPSYKLSHFLQKYLKDNYKFSNNRSINSSTDFAHKVCQSSLRNTHRMMSLDVVNMFTSVPLQDTVAIIESNLKDNENISEEEVNEILRLIRLTLKHNYFSFNNVLYSQTQGLPMGSPLSGILANIYMDSLENQFLNNLQNRSAIESWDRFVDDIFLIYDLEYINAQQILDGINNLHPSVQFTKEEEIMSSLNHLDLTLNRHNNKIECRVYRKPTTTNHTIDAKSNHPMIHKLAAYRYFVNRAFVLPLSNKNFNIEINTIKEIAKANGYQEKLIDKLVNKQRLNLKKTKYNVKGKEVDTKYTALTYVNEGTYKLAHLLKSKYNLNIAFTTKNTIGQQIHNNNIEIIPKFQQSGVYRLECQHKDCHSTYVGRTGRTFNIRYEDHVKGEYRNKHTAFSEHVHNENHAFTNIGQDMEILHRVKNGIIQNTLEAIEINLDKGRINNSNLNEQTHDNFNILFSLLK